MSAEMEEASTALSVGTNRGVSKPDADTRARATVDRINRRHRRILEFGKKALDEAINIGCELSDIKSSLPHGQWLPWVEKNLEFTDRTASRYMRLWDRRDYLNQTGVSDLSEAYTLLSEPKKEVRESATAPEKTPTKSPSAETIIEAEIVDPDSDPKLTSCTAPQPLLEQADAETVKAETAASTPATEPELTTDPVTLESLVSKIKQNTTSSFRNMLSKFDPEIRGQLLAIMIGAHDGMWEELWKDPELSDHPLYMQSARPKSEMAKPYPVKPVKSEFAPIEEQHRDMIAAKATDFVDSLRLENLDDLTYRANVLITTHLILNLALDEFWGSEEMASHPLRRMWQSWTGLPYETNEQEAA